MTTLDDLEREEDRLRRAAWTCGHGWPADPPGPAYLGTTCQRPAGHPPPHRVTLAGQVGEW